MRLLKLILGWLWTKIEDFLRGAQIEYRQGQADRGQQQVRRDEAEIVQAQAEVKRVIEKLASLEERAKRLKNPGSDEGS